MVLYQNQKRTIKTVERNVAEKYWSDKIPSMGEAPDLPLKILNKLGYSNYILIGHCVGGLIALETAQYLQKKNVQVSDVTLISSNIPKQKSNYFIAGN